MEKYKNNYYFKIQDLLCDKDVINIVNHCDLDNTDIINMILSELNSEPNINIETKITYIEHIIKDIKSISYVNDVIDKKICTQKYNMFEQILDGLKSKEFQMCIIGEANAGKSTIINCIIGSEVCIIDREACTAIPIVYYNDLECNEPKLALHDDFLMCTHSVLYYIKNNYEIINKQHELHKVDSNTKKLFIECKENNIVFEKEYIGNDLYDVLCKLNSIIRLSAFTDEIIRESVKLILQNKDTYPKVSVTFKGIDNTCNNRLTIIDTPGTSDNSLIFNEQMISNILKECTFCFIISKAQSINTSEESNIEKILVDVGFFDKNVHMIINQWDIYLRQRQAKSRQMNSEETEKEYLSRILKYFEKYNLKISNETVHFTKGHIGLSALLLLNKLTHNDVNIPYEDIDAKGWASLCLLLPIDDESDVKDKYDTLVDNKTLYKTVENTLIKSGVHKLRYAFLNYIKNYRFINVELLSSKLKDFLSIPIATNIELTKDLHKAMINGADNIKNINIKQEIYNTKAAQWFNEVEDKKLVVMTLVSDKIEVTKHMILEYVENTYINTKDSIPSYMKGDKSTISKLHEKDIIFLISCEKEIIQLIENKIRNIASTIVHRELTNINKLLKAEMIDIRDKLIDKIKDIENYDHVIQIIESIQIEDFVFQKEDNTKINIKLQNVKMERVKFITVFLSGMFNNERTSKKRKALSEHDYKKIVDEYIQLYISTYIRYVKETIDTNINSFKKGIDNISQNMYKRLTTMLEEGKNNITKLKCDYAKCILIDAGFQSIKSLLDKNAIQ